MTSSVSFQTIDALLAPWYTLQFYSHGYRVYDLTPEVKKLIEQCALKSLTYEQTTDASRAQNFWFGGFIDFVFERSQELAATALSSGAEKGSPAWDALRERIVANYTPEEWDAKEAARRVVHTRAMDAALWDCIALSSEFASLDPYAMATYLAEKPNPHRWGNLTALVDRAVLERVEEWAEDIRQAQIDREDYLSHLYDD